MSNPKRKKNRIMMYLMSNALASFTAPFIIPCTINEHTPTRKDCREGKLYKYGSIKSNAKPWMFGF